MNKTLFLCLFFCSSISFGDIYHSHLHSDTVKTKPIKDSQRLGANKPAPKTEPKVIIKKIYVEKDNKENIDTPLPLLTQLPENNLSHLKFDSITLLNGEVIYNAKLQRIEKDQLVLLHSNGIKKIELSNLPDNVRTNIGLLSYQQIKDIEEKERLEKEKKVLEDKQLEEKRLEAEIKDKKQAEIESERARQERIVIAEKERVEREKKEKIAKEKWELAKAEVDRLDQIKQEEERKIAELENIRLQEEQRIEMIYTIINIIIAIIIYFAPSIISFSCHRPNSRAILALNTFLGWTFIGWVAALVWALIKTRKQANKP